MTSPMLPSRENLLRSFNEEIIEELPTGGTNSINRLMKVYEKMKTLIPDFKNEKIEQIFSLKAEGKSYTKEYQNLRLEIIQVAKMALDPINESKEKEGDDLNK
jgi:uncharacterized protein YicC (UPF0701 family)